MDARWAHTLLTSAFGAILASCTTVPTDVDQPPVASEQSSADCGCEKSGQLEGGGVDSRIEMADFDEPVIPLPRSEEVSLGPDDAPIRILMYVDIACPYSKDAWESIASIIKENSPHVRVAVRHFPVHQSSDAAQMQVEAAARLDKNKAIALLESFFEDPPSGMGFLFGDRSVPQVITDNIGRAQLDQQALERVVEEGQLQYVVMSDSEEARRLGFTGTPGTVINGVRVHGALSKEGYQLLVDRFMSSHGSEARNQ